MSGEPLGSALLCSQKRTIADRYTKGETMADLAREYECGTATIWRAINGPFEGAVASV